MTLNNKFKIAMAVIATSCSVLFSCNKENNIMGNIDKEISNLNIFNDSSINLYGRSKVIDYNNKKQVFFGFTATGFELICEPTSEINEIKATLLSESESHEHQYIKTYIDGKEKEVIELNKGEQEVTLFKNLQAGKHQLKVLKMNELSTTKLYMSSLAGSNLKYYKRTYNPKRNLIEFYGDSITAGYGNLGDPSSKTYLTKEQDGTLSYAQQLADKLDCDSSIIAWSGIALTKTLAPYGVDMMDKYDTYDGVNKYDGENNKPKIAIINLGSNDYGGYFDENKSSAEKKKGIEEFIKNYGIIVDYIKARSPECKIISCYNMCYDIGTKLISAIKTSNSNINEKYGANTGYVLQFGGNQSGSNGHPSLIAHNTYTKILYDFIEKNIK